MKFYKINVVCLSIILLTNSSLFCMEQNSDSTNPTQDLFRRRKKDPPLDQNAQTPETSLNDKKEEEDIKEFEFDDHCTTEVISRLALNCFRCCCPCFNIDDND